MITFIIPECFLSFLSEYSPVFFRKLIQEGLMHKLFTRIIALKSRFTVRYPLVAILLVALVTIPAYHQVKKIKLRTNLLRLLPKSTRAATNTVKLDKYVSSDGGHFFFLISQTRTNKPPQFKNCTPRWRRPSRG